MARVPKSTLPKWSTPRLACRRHCCKTYVCSECGGREVTYFGTYSLTWNFATVCQQLWHQQTRTSDHDSPYRHITVIDGLVISFGVLKCWQKLSDFVLQGIEVAHHLVSGSVTTHHSFVLYINQVTTRGYLLSFPLLCFHRYTCWTSSDCVNSMAWRTLKFLSHTARQI